MWVVKNYCGKCVNTIKCNQYNNLPLLSEWIYPIYSSYLDLYFYDEDELLEYISDAEDLNIKELKLNYDNLNIDEDYVLPENIQLLLDNINNIAIKEIIGYTPDYRYKIIMGIQQEDL